MEWIKSKSQGNINSTRLLIVPYTNAKKIHNKLNVSKWTDNLNSLSPNHGAEWLDDVCLIFIHELFADIGAKDAKYGGHAVPLGDRRIGLQLGHVLLPPSLRICIGKMWVLFQPVFVDGSFGVSDDLYVGDTYLRGL